MCGNRVGGYRAAWLYGADGETLLIQFHKHAARKSGTGADAAALYGLGCMPAGCRITALHKRVSSHDCSVGRTSANDDVCAVFECFFVGFRTQKCYDGAALIKGFFGDFRCTVEGRNFAFTIFFLDDFRVLLGVNAGNLFVDAGLFADFPDQLQGSVDAFIGTTGSGRADGHRNAQLVGTQYHAL